MHWCTILFRLLVSYVCYQNRGMPYGVLLNREGYEQNRCIYTNRMYHSYILHVHQIFHSKTLKAYILGFWWILGISPMFRSTFASSMASMARLAIHWLFNWQTWWFQGMWTKMLIEWTYRGDLTTEHGGLKQVDFTSKLLCHSHEQNELFNGWMLGFS